MKLTRCMLSLWATGLTELSENLAAITYLYVREDMKG